MDARESPTADQAVKRTLAPGAENYKNLGPCIHCGVDVIYGDPRDASFFHRELTGSANIGAPGYDNGYWCNNKCMTTSATPRGVK